LVFDGDSKLKVLRQKLCKPMKSKRSEQLTMRQPQPLGGLGSINRTTCGSAAGTFARSNLALGKTTPFGGASDSMISVKPQLTQRR
jgi:hypothetical protein